MAEVVAAATKEVLVSTPYFVPGDEGVAFWKSVVDSGVKVPIVTNSLASTNHIAVHSAYAGYRKKLLQAGVDLYEVRANAVTDATSGDQPISLTLHTKAASIDGRYTFVGSLNLDPRSIDINTEMGVLVDATALSESLTERSQATPTGARLQTRARRSGKNPVARHDRWQKKSSKPANRWRAVAASSTRGYRRSHPESQM